MNKEISIEESKHLLTDILKCVDCICRNNNLRYSLDYGTMLGAVRHKGFIPWDDDIDIFMPRSDFEKFKVVFHSDRYELLTEENKSWARHFIRVCDTHTFLVFEHPFEQIPRHGLWIAVFPIDCVPDDNREWKKMQREINFWDGCRRIKHSMWVPSIMGRNIVMYLGKLILSPISAKYLNYRTIKCMKRHSNTETLSCYEFGRYFHVYPSSFYDKYIDIEFEGQKFMCIAKYDEYLRLTYGDYMTPPPINERIPKRASTKIVWFKS